MDNLIYAIQDFWFEGIILTSLTTLLNFILIFGAVTFKEKRQVLLSSISYIAWIISTIINGIVFWLTTASIIFNIIDFIL